AADWLTEAWNPYMPMMWWVVFLLAVWSVLCDDLLMLPIAVFAGSFCAQTHIPYLGLVLGVSGFMTVVLAWRAWQRRRVASPADPDDDTKAAAHADAETDDGGGGRGDGGRGDGGRAGRGRPLWWVLPSV